MEVKLALNENGLIIGRVRVQKLMKQMGIRAIYPKPKLSKRHSEHRVYPYLLRGYQIVKRLICPSLITCPETG
ncbi:MAG: IS3 family transposase [Nitrospirota bacterium]